MNELAYSRPAISLVNPDIQQTVREGGVNELVYTLPTTSLINPDIQQTVRVGL